MQLQMTVNCMLEMCVFREQPAAAAFMRLYVFMSLQDVSPCFSVIITRALNETSKSMLICNILDNV